MNSLYSFFIFTPDTVLYIQIKNQDQQKYSTTVHFSQQQRFRLTTYYIEISNSLSLRHEEKHHKAI